MYFQQRVKIILDPQNRSNLVHDSTLHSFMNRLASLWQRDQFNNSQRGNFYSSNDEKLQL